MSKLLLSALDWAEVWALLIPLGMLSLKPTQPLLLKPVIIYIWMAFLLNLTIDLIIPFKQYLPSWLQSNNPFYNIHSIIRFTCFSVFFIQLPQPSFVILKKSLVIFSVIFLVINFGFFENFFNPDYFSGNLLATEAYLLLIYCLQYYLSELRDDNNNLSEGPAFWVVTGLGIYVVVNFFVFLFYVPMIYVDSQLAQNIWDVHNIAFIIFCIFITKAFYGTVRNKHSV